MADIVKIHQLVDAMRQQCAGRSHDAYLVRMVRKGKMHELYPQHFADDMPQAMVANTIDNAARDTAELVAPLPSVACSSGNMNSSADASRSAKKNKIASYYWEQSRLELQNLKFSDSTISYAFGVYLVDPDFENQCPRIRWESSFDCYYYHDRFDRLVWLAKIKKIDVLTLCSMYAGKAPHIKYMANGKERSGGEMLEVVTYRDRERNVVYLPECNVVVAEWKNPVGMVMAAVAERPDQEDRPRGQYDDAVYPMLGRAIMTMLQLQAAAKAIEAPIAMPDDVTEMPFGPDATLRTQNPQAIQRVRLDIPDDIFAVGEQLDRAVKEGSRYPEARTGGINANIITGQGVEALMGTMNTQVRTMQTVIGKALEEVTDLCFRLDVALWGNVQKKITGVLTGKPFEVTYTPSKDIGDSYSCKVTYGFASGQTPAQAIVAMLQLRGDKLISRDTFRRQLPFTLDPEEEQRQVDAEDLTAAYVQGLMGLEQAIGPMVMQGQNPVQLMTAFAKMIQLRKKGKSIEEAALEAFKPPEQPEEPQVPEQPGPPGLEAGGPPPGPGGPDLPPGVQPNGRMQGVAPGQQGVAPGGLPDVKNLLASLRGNGQARMEASTARRSAI